MDISCFIESITQIWVLLEQSFAPPEFEKMMPILVKGDQTPMQRPTLTSRGWLQLAQESMGQKWDYFFSPFALYLPCLEMFLPHFSQNHLKPVKL